MRKLQNLLIFELKVIPESITLLIRIIKLKVYILQAV